MRKLLLLVIFSVLFASSVFALGITPGRTTLEYGPGQTQTGTFKVINSEHKDMDIVLLLQGDMNRSISLSEVSFHMSAAEGEKAVQFTIAMPLGLSPGEHQTDIIAVQLPGKSETSEAFVGASVAVATQIVVFVPYPGKYIDTSLEAIGPDPKGQITFVVPVISRGKLDITRIRGSVQVYGALNEEIETISTNEISLKSGEHGELVAVYTPTVPPGTYRAQATVIYDEQVVVTEKQFNVGSPVLDLQQIEVNDFSLGEIAKFEMLVESKWGQPIEGAYAEMLIYNNDGETMADFKSQTYNVDSLGKTLMVAFWDTDGVKEGEYKADLFLRFGEHSVQKGLSLKVSDNEINIVGVGYVISPTKKSGSSGSMTTILIVAIIVLILVNLSWFLVLRRMMHKKVQR